MRHSVTELREAIRGRSIGLARMRAWATMKTLTYNLKRLEALIQLGKLPIDGIGVPG